MRKFILPSIILALLSIIPLLFRDPVTMQTPSLINWGYIVLSFLVTFLIVRRYKLVYSNGNISYGMAFKYGLKVSVCYAVIASVIYLIYAELYLDSIVNAMKAAIKVSQEKSLDANGSISASSEKMMNTIITVMSNPFVISAIALISYLFYGLIFSLISAAIVKTKTES